MNRASAANGSTYTPIGKAASPVGNQRTVKWMLCSARWGVRKAQKATAQLSSQEIVMAAIAIL